MTEPEKSTSFTTRLKEGIAALREAVIVVAIIILLMQPRCIGEIAKEAGLKSGFGFEFFDQLQESQEETGKAQAALEAVTDELTQLKRQLQTLGQTAGSTSNSAILASQIKRLARNADSLEQKSVAIKPFLQNSVRLQSELLRKAPSRK